MSYPYPKPKRIVNEALLEEIRQAKCCIDGCQNKAEPAHVKTRGSGGDDVPENLVPLCRWHHTEQHTVGWEEFCKRHPEVKTWAELQSERGFAAEKSWEEYLQALIDLSGHEEKARWLAGEIINEMRDRFGSRGLAKAVASELGCTARYVQELAKVARVFPEEKRIPALTWQHHRVAARTQDPYEWVQKAADNGWSVRQLEEEIKAARDPGNEEEKCRRAGERIIRAIRDLRRKYGELAGPVLEKIAEELKRETPPVEEG